MIVNHLPTLLAERRLKVADAVRATGVSKTTDAKKGDIVTTSGLGELFPAGIYVGTVEEVKNDKYNLSKTVYIKTTQDFNNIHYVTILKEKK